MQVIDWAQKQAAGKLTYAIALVYDDTTNSGGHERGLIWLVGMDGNDTAISADDIDRQSRMLARRQRPVGIPPRDQMPAGAPDPYNNGTETR